MTTTALTLVSSEKSTNVRFYKGAPEWLRKSVHFASTVSPSLTTSVAAWLFFRTQRGKVRAEERAVLQTATRFEVDGLAAWSWGEGPTVLLVHGWNGRASQMGAFVQPLVDRGYRVVSFDANGHGQSPGNDTSLPKLANNIRAVAEAVGGVYGVITHSMGGASTTIALSEGLQAESAVFVSPPAEPSEFVSMFADMIGIPDSARDLLLARIEKRVGRRIAELRGPTLARRLRNPLLVIHDHDDKQVPSHYGESIARAWPGARFMGTNGLGHRRILRAEPVIRAAIDFIDVRDESARAAA